MLYYRGNLRQGAILAERVEEHGAAVGADVGGPQVERGNEPASVPSSARPRWAFEMCSFESADFQMTSSDIEMNLNIHLANCRRIA
jgi:hypothetical protein